MKPVFTTAGDSLDALLDIKPFTAKFDRMETTRNGWQHDVDEDTAKRRGVREFRDGSG